ncbi:MAG: RNB domain-containing ribonuclease [Methanomicrobiales archaeon]|nr:RNB domain-containing ribonuclease [Methanomicrobiales archaeon]
MNKHTIDMKAIARSAMDKYGFDVRFPESVQEEVNAIQERIFAEGDQDGRDLRDLLWSSIDNWDSMDLDQLEYCEGGTDGEIHVRIAIADVDLYVPKGSQADLYGAHNGTSVYTGIEIFPLFPDKLSRGITSLLPGQDRMAVVIEYSVLRDGNTRPGDIHRALVRNKAKLVYEEAGDWFVGAGTVPQEVRDVPGLKEQLMLQVEVMLRLKKHRIDNGALDLDTLEAHAVLEEGSVRDLVVQEQNMARNLIEEFMVAANGVMVSFLGNANLPMIQRIVRIPKNWEGIVQLAAQYYDTLPAIPDSKALSLFLDRRKAADPERFPDLSLAVIKLLGPGEYMTLEPDEPPYGHFALAVTDYTHATAPNRRYVDLVNQRLVKSVINRSANPYTLKELVSHSTWLTDREKASKKVERFMRKSAAAVLLENRIGESFEGLVTGAKESGTYVRLITPPAEGRIIRGERGLFVGQKVRVRLLKTNPYKGFVDFECSGTITNHP